MRVSVLVCSRHRWGSPRGWPQPRVGATLVQLNGGYNGVLDKSLRSLKTQEEADRLLIDRTGAFINDGNRGKEGEADTPERN